MTSEGETEDEARDETFEGRSAPAEEDENKGSISDQDEKNEDALSNQSNTMEESKENISLSNARPSMKMTAYVSDIQIGDEELSKVSKNDF